MGSGGTGKVAPRGNGGHGDRIGGEGEGGEGHGRRVGTEGEGGVSRTNLRQNHDAHGTRKAAPRRPNPSKVAKDLNRIDANEGQKGSGVLTTDLSNSPGLRVKKSDAQPGKGAAADSPSSDGVATYQGKGPNLFRRAWDWLLSSLDPRFAPERPAGDVVRHSDIARDANSKKEETKSEWDESTRPGEPAYGPTGFRSAIARYAGRMVDAVKQVVDLKTRTKDASLKDVQSIVAEGHKAMDGTPRWGWTRAKVQEALMRRKGLTEADLALPGAKEAMDRAVDMILTENVSHEIGSKVASEKELNREDLKADALRRMEAMGLTKLSSDPGKAVDSLIDHFIIAKEAGILDVTGGLTVEQVTPLMAALYLTDNPTIRIDKTELTHVPMVGENMQKFYAEFHAAKQSRFNKHKPTTPSERKVAFLTALLHDAGKNVPLDKVKTVTGFNLQAKGTQNTSRVTIEVPPNKSLVEVMKEAKENPAFLDAVIQANQEARAGETDPAKLQKMPDLKTHEDALKHLDALPLTGWASFFVGTVVHHDSVNVLGYVDPITGEKHPGAIDHLVEQGLITKEEAHEMRQAIQLHGMVSTWVLDQTFGGLRIQSNVFLDKKYHAYIDLYMGVHGEMAKGVDPRVLEKSSDVPFPKKAPGVPSRLVGKSWKKIMKNLRKEFDKLPALVQAMFFADHMGQADFGKYMVILAGKPENAGRSPYQLIFGHDAKDMNQFTADEHPRDTDMMQNAFFGVGDTHPWELYANNKEMGAKAEEVYSNVRSWVKQNLATSLLNAMSGARSNPNADAKVREMTEAYDKFAADRLAAGQSTNVITWLQALESRPFVGTIGNVVAADYYRDYAIVRSPDLHVKL